MTKLILPSFDVFLLPEVKGQETLIAGVDEVGRGALFGPVVAGAVVVPVSAIDQLTQLGVKDSKQLSPKRRVELAQQIKGLAIDSHVSFATVGEIDQINILQASLKAMYRAVVKLKINPAVCLVDGRHPLPNLEIRQENIIKGDERSPVIAAASILAKVWRDNLIVRLAQKYPQYDLIANKGYGTLRHREALLKYGASPQHRLSFRPCCVSKN
ncbi:Ribonuclease H [Gloeothece citriformis PCC 7424]|uniref:Ribonuclease HII n=1 Tax=Gloeothece citriformis (strain PCC 7424) TaxID=65393 RepID=B7K828_GLOC7|nr:ribonuclease HII [Gloeothece citriformis]ACK68516.1 Ribonuclease H [Gloeothece citriformis PCC 7424]